jgi:hypothetical protein
VVAGFFYAPNYSPFHAREALLLGRLNAILGPNEKEEPSNFWGLPKAYR